MPAPPVPLLTSTAEVEHVASRIAGASRIAFDTEGASFHRYVDRIYLVQLSTDTETVLIDPLAVNGLDPIGRMLAAPDIEVVFHDADYDLRTLDRDYGFRARRLFDTRVAAELSGEPAVGLGSLLEKHFGVKLDKKFQRADWSARPLPDAMLAYAAADTRHLLDLRDLLAERLEGLNRLAWAEEEFRHLESVRWTGPSPDDDASFLRLKGAKTLRGRKLAVLKALYQWRDRTARARDRAPFRVLGNDALLGLARVVPRTHADLLGVAELPAKLAHRHDAELLEAIEEGLAVPPDQVPHVEQSPRPTRDPEHDARFERLKALRNRRAKQIGLDPGTVCPNNTLQTIARLTPTSGAELQRIEALREWQRELLGEGEIVRAVRNQK